MKGYYNMIDLKLQEKKFDVRINISKVWTLALVNHLKKIGHIVDFREATLEEDKNDLIDFWFKYPNNDEFIPIAFKIRVCPFNRDIHLAKYKPFWGVDSDRTVVGRDFICVTSSPIQQYYVAVKKNDQFDEIYRISKLKLKSIVTELDENWHEGHNEIKNSLVPHKELTSKKNNFFMEKKLFKGKGSIKMWSTPSGEVWWHKNQSENFSKVNYYIPEAFKEESLLISNDQYIEMVKGINV